MAALGLFGERLGLVFQVADDLLDWDEGRAEPSFPSLLGVEGSRERLARWVQAGLEPLRSFGERAESLRLLLRYAAWRER